MNKRIVAIGLAMLFATGSLTSCREGNSTLKHQNKQYGFSETTIISPAENDEFNNRYTLEEMVVLSRHNIRSPISDKDSVIGKITPYEWFNWSSNASELSLRGGALETIMGQYFRKWLESENLIPENYQPQEGKVRFYANSK